MTHRVFVYGFGSAFGATGEFSDVDLLIVHRDTNLGSAKFAIACKRHLTASVVGADITMLSEAEERHCQFIKSSQAVPLGAICENNLADDLAALNTKVLRQLF